mmetsp:Transcript_14751/g.41543  ORF Transcript_14751/g.41543 Transcript_14751/m.41543 type:complete len:107 (+) Transcript_14751:872-1192(+)
MMSYPARAAALTISPPTKPLPPSTTRALPAFKSPAVPDDGVAPSPASAWQEEEEEDCEEEVRHRPLPWLCPPANPLGCGSAVELMEQLARGPAFAGSADAPRMGGG